GYSLRLRRRLTEIDCPGPLPGDRISVKRFQRMIEDQAWPHCLKGEGIVGSVVAADLDGTALHAIDFVQNPCFILRECPRQRCKARLKIRVGTLPSQRLRPVEGE